MRQTVLILGAQGLIGRTIHNSLSKKGFITVCADKNVPSNQKDHFIRLDILNADAFNDAVTTHNPDIIINCVNIATICSHDAPGGYNTFVRFYTSLYHTLASLKKPVHYLQVGTTGSGGLGFSIPFTHGDKIEDLPIIHKAAFAGITTALLSMMSRSFLDQRVTVSEIKPGLALFDRNLQPIHLKHSTCFLIDGGESGYYTYDELALLTSYMGFTTVQRIVEKIEMILQSKKAVRRTTRYNLTATTNDTIIKQDGKDLHLKHITLKKMLRSQKKLRLIATGNLGPPEITRDLILAHLAQSDITHTAENFEAAFKHDESITQTLGYIHKHNPSLAEYLSNECIFTRFASLVPFCSPNQQPWETVKRMIDDRNKQLV